MRACLELEMPLTTIQTCHSMNKGEVIQINSTTIQNGVEQDKVIEVEMRRGDDDKISLALYADVMGRILQDKLTSHWLCILDRISSKDTDLDDKNVGPIKIPQSPDHCPRRKKKTETSSSIKTRRKCAKKSARLMRKKKDDLSEDDETADVGLELEAETKCATDSEAHPLELSTELEKNSSKVENESNHSGTDIESQPVCAAEQISMDSDDETILTDKDDKKKHRRAAREKLKLACKFCQKPFIKGKNPLMNLQIHIMKRCQNLHPENSIKEEDIKTEESEKDKSDLLSCQFCSKSYTTKYNRDRHAETCKRNPDNKVDLTNFDLVDLHYCDTCNWPTLTELDLHKHRVQNHGAPRKPRKKAPPGKPVACRYCGMMFRFTSSRCNHEHFKCQKNLNVTKSFFCRYCGTRCRSQEALDIHTEQKHRDKKCICKICGAEFNTRNSKWHHMATVHRDNPRRFACPHCDHTYFNKRMLLQHITKHFEERKVQCSICGKCFKNQAQEKSHRLHVHEGRYRYRCEQCGHGVAKLQYLHTHKCGRVRRVQDGEKSIEIEQEKADPVSVVETRPLNPPQSQQPLIQPPQLPLKILPQQPTATQQQPVTMQLQQPPMQQSLTTQPLVPIVSHGNIMTGHYDMKIQNQIVNPIENDALYYASQQASILPSFSESMHDNRVPIQMTGIPGQSLPTQHYMTSYNNFLHYQNPNC